jgi:hypothetical protein
MRHKLHSVTCLAVIKLRDIFAALVALHEVEAGFTFRNNCGNTATHFEEIL